MSDIDKDFMADEDYGLPAVPEGEGVNILQEFPHPLGEPYNPEKDEPPVNVSEIQDWMRCRFRWFCKWVLNRVPRVVPVPLGVGKAGHVIFEDYLLGKSTMAEAVDKQVADIARLLDTETNPDIRNVMEETVTTLTDLREPLSLWSDTYKFDYPTIEVEEPFIYRDSVDPTILWRGRPDRVGIMEGKMFHVQTKFFAPGAKFTTVAALARRSYHEHLYADYLSKKYMSLGDGYTLPDGTYFQEGIPYGGTLFNFVRKLKYRTKRTKANPDGEVKRLDEMFWQCPVAIDVYDNIHAHVMECMRSHVREMRTARLLWKAQQIVPAPNEHMNGGVYGNSIDPYFGVLLGEVDLMNEDIFMARQDTYEKPEGAVA